MKRFLTMGIAAAAFALIAGCTNIATFNSQAAPEPMVSFPAPPKPKSVTVLPFLDQRSRKSLQQLMPAADGGSFYLGLIPLMPYGYVKKPYPENSDDFVSLGRFHFDPVRELATASALSLKASNLFSRVEQANSPEEAGTDYIWQGTVTNTYYSGALLTYCVTYFASPALWALGAPEGVSRNALGVEFALVERETGDVVWQYRFDGEDFLIHWIYARVGKDVSLYPVLMRQAMNGALANLHASMPAL